jgi:SAM-dependent methyltransferase
MDPFTTPMESSWGGEIHHICFNDECGYFVKSWDSLENQGVEKTGYRCRIDPRGSCGPQAVWSKDALKDRIVCEPWEEKGTFDYFDPLDFARDQEGPDAEFYEKPRIIDHLDSLALATVEELFARLIPEGSRILDLMAGPSSHLPGELNPVAVTGVGLNQEELDANAALTDKVIHDINGDPRLPSEDELFDVALLTISVQYVTHPIEIFREVARVLKPGGLFITTFSNRMFPPKSVNIWKATNESERVELVQGYYAKSDRFVVSGDFESKGKPRPEDDKYYEMGIPSDPIYAVWGKATK